MTHHRELRVGLVGARGWVGQELAGLLARHPAARLDWASSRQPAGALGHERAAQGASGPAKSGPGQPPTARVSYDAEQVARSGADVVVLALPNALSAPYVQAIDAIAPQTVVLDLSADHRFDAGWAYGLVERNRERLRGARRIAVPGCYATAMQLGLAPLLPHLAGVPRAFGVSGYSGAGTAPSPKNDPARLEDNLLPYQLTDHLHEREASRHLGVQIRFVPHVAPFFRGLSVTLSADLNAPAGREELVDRLRVAYADEPLVHLLDDPPEVRDARDRHGCRIGGLRVSDDGHAVSLVCALDNLLKGAATQALQNLNLACGLPERSGIAPPLT